MQKAKRVYIGIMISCELGEIFLTFAARRFSRSFARKVVFNPDIRGVSEPR